METFEEYQSRLAALAAEGAGSPGASPEASLAACRSARDRLRELKREILAQLFKVRAHIHRQAKRATGQGPTLGELWDRRDEGARSLVKDVQLRVIGLLDDKGGSAAVEAWARLNREIDAHLRRLAERERQLARAAVGEDDVASRPPGLPAPERRKAEKDDLYAAVGSAVQKGAKGGAFCSHCGQPIDAEDRFCRRCGHHLS